MLYFSDLHHSLRMRPTELIAESKDTDDTGKLKISLAKHDKLGNKFWYSIHHLRMSRFITECSTQREFRYFWTLECCKLGLEELCDDRDN